MKANDPAELRRLLNIIIRRRLRHGWRRALTPWLFAPTFEPKGMQPFDELTNRDIDRIARWLSGHLLRSAPTAGEAAFHAGETIPFHTRTDMRIERADS